MGKPRSAKKPHTLGALPAGLPNDQKIVRDGTRGLLEQHAILRIMGEAAVGAKAIRLAGELLPGVGITHVGLRRFCLDCRSAMCLAMLDLRRVARLPL